MGGARLAHSADRGRLRLGWKDGGRTRSLTRSEARRRRTGGAPWADGAEVGGVSTTWWAGRALGSDVASENALLADVDFAVVGQ